MVISRLLEDYCIILDHEMREIINLSEYKKKDFDNGFINFSFKSRFNFDSYKYIKDRQAVFTITFVFRTILVVQDGIFGKFQ